MGCSYEVTRGHTHSNGSSHRPSLVLVVVNPAKSILYMVYLLLTEMTFIVITLAFCFSYTVPCMVSQQFTWPVPYLLGHRGQCSCGWCVRWSSWNELWRLWEGTLQVFWAHWMCRNRKKQAMWAVQAENLSCRGALVGYWKQLTQL